MNDLHTRINNKRIERKATIRFSEDDLRLEAEIEVLVEQLRTQRNTEAFQQINDALDAIEATQQALAAQFDRVLRS